MQKLAGVVDDLTGRFRCKPEDLSVRVEALQEEIKKLQQQIKKAATGDLAGAADKLFDAGQTMNGVRIIIGQMPAGPDEQMRTQVDRLKQKAGSGVVVLGWAEDGKVGLLAAVTDDLVKKGLHAGKLIAQIAPIVGGKGGGRPNMAQAGGKDAAKLAERWTWPGSWRRINCKTNGAHDRRCRLGGGSKARSLIALGTTCLKRSLSLPFGPIW